MANLQVYFLTSPKDRGPNQAFYAFNKECEILECTIYGGKVPATHIGSKIQVGSYALLKNVNVSTRENVKYVQIKTDTAKVRIISLFHVHRENDKYCMLYIR